MIMMYLLQIFSTSFLYNLDLIIISSSLIQNKLSNEWWTISIGLIFLRKLEKIGKKNLRKRNLCAFRARNLRRFRFYTENRNSQNGQLRRVEKMGEKKIDNIFSKGQILAYKKVHFWLFWKFSKKSRFWSTNFSVKQRLQKNGVCHYEGHRKCTKTVIWEFWFSNFCLRDFWLTFKSCKCSYNYSLKFSSSSSSISNSWTNSLTNFI